MTKFVILGLSAYWVEICWTEHDNLRLKKSTISKRELL